MSRLHKYPPPAILELLNQLSRAYGGTFNVDINLHVLPLRRVFFSLLYRYGCRFPWALARAIRARGSLMPEMLERERERERERQSVIERIRTRITDVNQTLISFLRRDFVSRGE